MTEVCIRSVQTTANPCKPHKSNLRPELFALHFSRLPGANNSFCRAPVQSKHLDRLHLHSTPSREIVFCCVKVKGQRRHLVLSDLYPLRSEFLTTPRPALHSRTMRLWWPLKRTNFCFSSFPGRYNQGELLWPGVHREMGNGQPEVWESSQHCQEKSPYRHKPSPSEGCDVIVMLPTERLEEPRKSRIFPGSDYLSLGSLLKSNAHFWAPPAFCFFPRLLI